LGLQAVLFPAGFSISSYLAVLAGRILL